MRVFKDINEFRQQIRVVNLTEEEIKSDFENQFVKKKRNKKNNINKINENITFDEYKSLICNFLFQHTEEDLLKEFKILQIKFKYQQIKRELKLAKKEKDFNLIAKYQSDLDNLLNIKRDNQDV
ncbi:hypothetical protein MCEME33_00908 [Candidatus Pelagibacterales bacterium]